MTTCKHKIHKFTLIELIIAGIIFTMMATSIVMISANTMKTWRKLQDEKIEFTELMLIDKTFDNTFSNIIPFYWKDENNKRIPVFLGLSDKITFVYRHPISELKEGGLRFTSIYVDDDKLTVAYQSRPPLDVDNVEEDTTRYSILAEGIESINFEYADWSEDKKLFFVDEWDPDRDEIPLGVKILLKWSDGRVETWFRRTSGSGFKERFGKWQESKDAR